MKNLLNLRIFWTCKVAEQVDGYYYYWDNWANGRFDSIFAGYNKKALNNKEKTFEIVKQRIDG